jgi:hypothetical protein
MNKNSEHFLMRNFIDFFSCTVPSIEKEGAVSYVDKG